MAALLIAAVLSPAWASNEVRQGNNEDKKNGGGGPEFQVQIDVKFITVETADSRRFRIDWVAVGDGRSMVYADASKGVSQESQDRIDLSFIPFLGGVARYRYTADDVSAETRIGSAWILNSILLVALDGERMDILSLPRIVVLNGNSAFVMETPALPNDRPSQSELAAIGATKPFSNFTTPNISQPETRTVLIGGLDTPEKIQTAKRVPWLADIPTLGRLFLGSAHQRDTNELVILVHPSIIVTDD